MGSQLAKSDNANSGSVNRFSSNESYPKTLGIDQQSTVAAAAKSIVVVKQGPSVAGVERLVDSKLQTIPTVCRPLIPIGQTLVSSSYPQIDPQTIINIGQELEAELRLNSELVNTEQVRLVDKIRYVDQQLLQTTNNYCSEKQRRANKASDNFTKISEIDQLIGRCEADIDHLVTVLAKLNTALPEDLCLENFQLLSWAKKTSHPSKRSHDWFLLWWKQ